MNMETSNSFIKSLKEGYDAIPYLQGSMAAKKLVADSIKSNGCNPSDVLSMLCSTMGVSSTHTDAEWKTVCDATIKNGGLMGKNLEVFKSSLKNKLSYEEMFNTAAMCCGKNPEALKSEIYLNKIGWDKVLVKLLGKKDETKAVVSKVDKKSKKMAKTEDVKVEKKSSIKSGIDTRAISIIGFKDGERKEWDSFKACEIETGAGHGTVSQYFSGKVKSVKGWKLYKKGEEPKVEAKKAKGRKENKKSILQVRITKAGKEKVVRAYNSITEAANATGISHSSISKAISGTYNTAGGSKWVVKSAEAAA